MKVRHYPSFGLLILLASCGPQRQPELFVNNSSAPILPAPSAPPAVTNKVQAQPQPAPTIDPKSSEAAVDLVQGFVDLLNQGKFNQAYMLLGPNAPPRSDFDRQFTRYQDLQVSVGQPGEQEGAAGSIYLSVPLTASALVNGEHSSRSGTAVVRRVNDVPGSTEAERHWHIERIDFSGNP
jgi:hypothetical protein